MIERLEMLFPHESKLTLLTFRDDAGIVIGTVTCKTVGKTVEFSRLFVIEPARQQGVGRQLVQEIVRAAQGGNFESVSCVVHPENEDALKFYRALGFFHATVLDGGFYLMAIQIN